MSAPSIYDWREAEYEAAERIRKERRAMIIEALVCGPLRAALAVAWVILCAVM